MKTFEQFEIIEKCNGCSKAVEVANKTVCTVYAFPESKWSGGNCPMATHLEKKETKKEKMINPLKASKRSMGK